MNQAPSVAEQTLERIAEGVFAVGPDWRFTFVNSAAAKLAGRPASELLGKVVWEEFPQLLGTDLERHARAALDARRSVVFETRVGGSDGPWYTVRLFASDSGMTGYFGDASMLHAALNSLAERSAQQSALAEFSYRCLTARTVDAMLRDAVALVAGTLHLPLTQVRGRPHSGAPLQVIVEAGPLAGSGDVSTLDCARFVIPGTEDAELIAHTPHGTQLSDDQMSLIQAVVAMISGSARRLGDTEALQYLALHSQVSNLPNRRYLIEHLTRVLQEAEGDAVRPVVMTVEIDRMWLINSTYGYRGGDAIAIACARRLQRLTEPHAMLAHIPTDVFALVIEQPVGEFEPTRLARRIRAAMREPLRASTGEHFLNLKIGIAIGTPGARPEDVLRDAETAMQHAAPPENFAVFDEQARQAVIRRTTLERDLHGALARNEFRVFYQPIMDLQTGGAISVEALVRWQHPERGLIGPVEFIDAAEDSGLIIPIGAWVLEQACAQGGLWRELLGRPLRVAVNISARQMADPGFGQFVADVAARTGLSPTSIGLEITESVLVEEAESANETLEDLRERGIRIAIDDFGTGYSSLSYLKRLAVDSLKIDRSFITELTSGTDVAIVEAVVKMARALGVATIAEGVEEPEQAQLLKQLGCARAQGYLYSRPLPADELEPFLKSH